MAHIVVLGAGIGGMTAAYEIREKLPSEHRVTVVGEGEQFSFTPSNPWLAVGWRTPDAITLPAGAKKRKVIAGPSPAPFL